MWNMNLIQNLITEQVQESLELEYKSAGALEKTDGKKKEIIKDVTAMANSAGGTIIYGIKEFDEQDKRHLPERVDPVDRRSISKEWLEAIINGAQPRIQDVKIEDVGADDQNNAVIYIVTIPQSFTAHQNPIDKKYYKRFNFSAEPMNDYEIRDTMNRGVRPIISIELKIESEIKYVVTDSFISRMPGQVREGPSTEKNCRLRIFAENSGAVYAQHIAGYIKIKQLYLSSYLKREIEPDEQGYVQIKFNNIKSIYSNRELVGEREVPVLPGMKENIDFIGLDYDAIEENLEGVISWYVCTENSQPRTGQIDISEIKKTSTAGNFKRDMVGNLNKI